MASSANVIRLGAVRAAAAPAAIAPLAVVRGWLYDPAEHWWALLVGAPPRVG